MLFKKLTGIWGHGVARIIKTQQKRNKNLVKLLLIKPTSQARKLASIPRLEITPASLTRPKLPRRASIAVPDPGKWLRASHSSAIIEGGPAHSRMAYWLYLPEKKSIEDLPLVVMLHGCAQTATQFAQSTRMNQLAEKKGFAVLYPQQLTLQNTGRCWRWYKKKVQDGEAEAHVVVEIIKNVVAKHGLDASRIYAAGISAGAAMANIIALNHPDLIAAIGLHSGSVFGVAKTPLEGYTIMQRGATGMLRPAAQQAAAKQPSFPEMPAIIIHGHEDTIVRPLNLSQLSDQFLELNHCAGHARDKVLAKITEKQAGEATNAYTMHEYYSGKKMILKTCEIYGLGHAWSGGDETARFSEGKGPDASKLMWDFFAKHKRESAAQISTPAPSKPRSMYFG